MKNSLLIITILFTSEIVACENSADFQAGFLGSIVSSGSSINSALIKLKSSKAGWFYEGDIIQEGYVLNKIKKNYILVQKRGKYFKIYLNSCEPLLDIDNPGLYLAANDMAEPSEMNEGLINTELTEQQQRIFLETPATDKGDIENKIQEQEEPGKLEKDQMRIFHKITEQKIEEENIDPDI